MERLTDAEIAELERLEKAATPGPWRAQMNSKYWEMSGPGYCEPIGDMCASSASAPEYGSLALGEANAELCVSARNALPRLLAELRERRAAEKWTPGDHCVEQFYEDEEMT